MTGFDPTAPDRDTDRDEPDEVPGNVVPPENLTGDSVHEQDEPGQQDAPRGDG
ncbi:hypothetical protein [uncultured Jatrophihabitans sp.]|uniref:hypothetical protein n=1 Tax=uncultured Jatrophihabitans sp. TaxID=1610747 RepID=UPI0035CC66DD